MNIFSDALWVSNSAGYNTLPIRAMATAATRDITHQTIATLRDFFKLLGF